MRKLLVLLICFILRNEFNYAQSVGIGTTSPHPSAQLEINSSTKGVLLPRLTTFQRTAISSPAKGLMVYDSTLNGFWYYTGSSWNSFITSNTGWTLNGNTGTDPSTNFIGTADNRPLVFKVNNQKGGYLGTTNNGNVFLGYQSGDGNIGHSNIGIGAGALANNSNSTWNTNLVAIGDSALFNERFYSASGNTAIGSKALFANLTGSDNTAIGYHALDSNTNGSENTAVGLNCLFSNLSGNFNSAFGSGALYYNTSGQQNVAIGYQAFAFNTTGSYNSSLGDYALASNYGGNYNTGTGYGALWHNQSGNNNSAIGDSSLYTNFSGSNNTGIGYSANVGQDYLTNATAIGALSRVDCSNCMVLGSVNGINGATSGVNIGIGQTNPLYPLDFGNSFGDKISLHGNFGNHYGIGIQNKALQLYTDSASGYIALGYGTSTSFTENVRFNGNGNVGMGVTNPQAKLHIKDGPSGYAGGYYLGFTFEGNGNRYFNLITPASNEGGFLFGLSTDAASGGIVYNNVSTSKGFQFRTNGNLIRMVVDQSGNVGIGTAAPTEKLNVFGNICATGSIGSCSDVRYKINILPVTNALSSILNLHGIFYNWNTSSFPELKFSDKKQIGFSAQEVEKILPEVVETDAKGYKSIDYGKMSPIMVEAIKEQQATIEKQQQQINQLLQEIESIKGKLK